MSVGHTMQGGHITDRLALAAKAQRKGYTVPIYPADVEWLLESHAEILEALGEAVEYVERFADMRDGDYGAPEPNEAMQLAHGHRLAIAKAEAR